MVSISVVPLFSAVLISVEPTLVQFFKQIYFWRKFKEADQNMMKLVKNQVKY